MLEELKNKIPEFVNAVDMVRDGGADLLITTVTSFSDSPELLYKALSYAAAQGITVEFVPDKQHPLLQFEKEMN